MKIFLTATSLQPEYGGPAVTVARLATALTEAGAEVGVWVADGLSGALLPPGSTARCMFGNVTRALDDFGKADFIHDNGIWMPHNHRIAVLAERRGIPRVVSTQGMLEPWALNHKRWKKSVAWRLYQHRDLLRSCCHHVTSDSEAKNVQHLGLGPPVHMIPNGVDVPQMDGEVQRRRADKVSVAGQRTAVFLGRIYPVKGLPMLVEAWRKLRPAGWRLLIAGPDEAGHRTQIENAVSAAGLGDVISFVGSVAGPAKQSALFDADLLVLPTHSESFGMAIAEALAHGVPVLTTTAAPWSMLKDRGCGWWVDATVDGIAEGLRLATSMDCGRLQAMGAKGRAFVASEFGWQRVANEYLAMYANLKKGVASEGSSSRPRATKGGAVPVKVFLAGTSLLPTYGGPAFSVSRLALALSEAGIEVGLWTPDQSAGSTPLLPSNSAVRRLTGTEAEAFKCFGRFDVLHDNGLWMPHNHRLACLASRHGIPRLVSTRGMLEPWAIRHKRWKKDIAWYLYQRRDLVKARYLHATAVTEADNLQRFKLGVRACMIPNGVDLPRLIDRNVMDSSGAKSDPRIALFLGRIYPVKGLPMLIEAWVRVRPEGWVLQIAGPDEAGHKAQVEKAVAAAGLGEVVSFLGQMDEAAKDAAMAKASIFVLPTHSESFGMVVSEALAHGLPVLTTHGAPWPMLRSRRCGWWVEPTVEGITEGLREATACDPQTLLDMGERGRELVAAEFSWDIVARKFVSIYEEVLVN